MTLSNLFKVSPKSYCVGLLPIASRVAPPIGHTFKSYSDAFLKDSDMCSFDIGLNTTVGLTLSIE